MKWLLSAGAIGLTIPRALLGERRESCQPRALVSDWVSGGRDLLAIRSIAENNYKESQESILSL